MSLAENVVSLKAVRTIKECDKLFDGYSHRLNIMDKTDLMIEFERYKKEAVNFPHHLLTVVKGKRLMRVIKCRAITEDMRTYAASEEKRLEIEVYKRLHEQEDNWR